MQTPGHVEDASAIPGGQPWCRKPYGRRFAPTNAEFIHSISDPVRPFHRPIFKGHGFVLQSLAVGVHDHRLNAGPTEVNTQEIGLSF